MLMLWLLLTDFTAKHRSFTAEIKSVRGSCRISIYRNSKGILGNKMPPRGRCPEKANFFRKWSVMITTFEIHNLGVFLQMPNWPN